MKNKFLNIFLFIFLIFSLVGCAGETGPQGPQGEQGIQGETGAQGQPGKDGHTPEITIGENGNWYVDGVDTGVSSKGESGQNGAQGEAGPQGEPGKDGAQGLQGEQGQPGKDGLSAYEIFLKYYPEYEGTEQEWITDVAMGNKCNLFGHEWDEGVITTEPTKGKDGEKTYSCLNCDQHKYEVLPKIEVADAEIYEVDGIKYVNYGSYPQTHVGDESLVEELNKLTTINSRGYYGYNGQEYAKVTTTPYQYGTYKDSYGNTQYYTYGDGKTVIKNVAEWFKVEPIKWRIISENTDGSYQLCSEYLLDAISYCDYAYLRSIDGNDVYRNNYKYSNVRAWLNGYNGTDYMISDYTNKGFYNRAFSDSEMVAILTIEVDNSDVPSNIYACENTEDKIYLLSSQDMNNCFLDRTSQCAKVSDYAKSVGAYWSVSAEYQNNGNYWLRSTYYFHSSDNSRHIAYNGDIDAGEYGNYGSRVDLTYNGIRVACMIYLEEK